MKVGVYIPGFILCLGMLFSLNIYRSMTMPEIVLEELINFSVNGNEAVNESGHLRLSSEVKFDEWRWQFFEGNYVKKDRACEVWYLSHLGVTDDLYSMNGFIETSKGRGYFIENKETKRVRLCFEGQAEQELSIRSFHVDSQTGNLCIEDESGLTYQIPERNPYRSASLVNMNTGDVIDLSCGESRRSGDWLWSLKQDGVEGWYCSSDLGEKAFCLNRQGDFIELNGANHIYEKPRKN